MSHSSEIQAPSDRRPPREARNKTPSRLKMIRYALEAAIVATFGFYVRLWPRAIVMWGADLLGWGAYFCLGEFRRVAYANLDIVLGDSRSRREKQTIVRGTFRHMSRTMAGLFWMPRLTREHCLRLVESTHVVSVLKRLNDENRGVVIVTCHYGDWELLLATSGLVGLPLRVVTEPTANPFVRGMIERLRTSGGNIPVPPRNAVLKLFRAVKSGGRVALVVDVNGRRQRGGVWLDFFGLQVFNGSGATELALRTNAAIVFVAAKPLPAGRTEILCHEIDFTPIGDHAVDVQTLSQKCVNACRDLIAEDPAPWLWTNKRWKRRPTAERGRYPFYSSHRVTGGNKT